MEHKEIHEKIKNLFENIFKECREKKFTVGEFEQLVFELQMALDKRRMRDTELF